MEILFQLKPSTAGALGMDDNNSIGTYQTGLINATTETQEKANTTAFIKIIDTEDCTVNSEITNATTYTSPQ